MYATHQASIGRFARDNADNMAQVIQFTYLTIQQSLEDVGGMMEDVNEKGYDSDYLWGWKRSAFADLDQYKEQYFDIAMGISDGYADPDTRAKELLRYFASLPGLGLVKGGFVVQLCFGLSGCLDRHNIAQFDVNPSTIKASRFKDAKTPKTRNKILDDYQDLIEKCGGTEHLWNSWCDYVASRRPNRFASGFEVSQYHCEAIGV